jgi:hypothetical protein
VCWLLTFAGDDDVIIGQSKTYTIMLFDIKTIDIRVLGGNQSRQELPG